MKSFLYFDILKKIALNHGVHDEGYDYFIEKGGLDLKILNDNHVFCTDFKANPNYYNLDINDPHYNDYISELDDSFLTTRNHDKNKISTILSSFDDDRDILSIPFDCCSFESSKDGRPISMGEDSTVFCVVLSEEFIDLQTVMILTIDSFGERKVTYSDNPEHFEIWKSVLFDTFIKINSNLVVNKKTSPKKDLRPINKRKMGQSKNKKNKPRNYLKITGFKYNEDDAVKINNKREDFSHCFEVRGHWRSIKGVGLNRLGVRCVNGATWVRPHKKGDDGEVIGKSRIIQ